METTGEKVMTYNELLAKVSIEESEGRATSGQRARALRAVVELAATYKDGNYVNEEFNQGLQTAFQLIIQAITEQLQ